jgi:thiol-disulfide isomerase/thioredoxin
MKRLVTLLALLTLSGLAAARAQTTISGTLLGHDATRMERADVALARPNSNSPILSVHADRNGRFKLTTKETGLLVLQCTGVGHRMYEVPLLIEKPGTIGLDVQLRGYKYEDDFSNVKIIGDFNSFSFKTGKAMERQPDGTYAADFPTTAKEFAYQLLGVAEGRSVNGTQSNDYVYDGGGDYRSIVTPVKGHARIVFDPKKLQRSNSAVAVRFNDPNSSVAKFSQILSAMNGRDEAYEGAMGAFKSSGKDPAEFHYDWSPELAKLTRQIAAEKEPLPRQALLFSYIEMPADNGLKDSAIARQAMAEIPPSSPLWAMGPTAVGTMLELAGATDDGYVDRVIADNPNADLKPLLLYSQLMSAEYAKNATKSAHYYTILTTKFADTRYAKLVKNEFAPDRKVMVGKSVPEFSLASLDDPKMVYTNENMKGKVYLIDFWATWCGPCLGEMANLHAAYEQYHPRGLQILSLSFDAQPGDVANFRQGKWKMPWMHTFIDGNFNSDVARRFEVSGIPKPVLVDANGTIIATEVDLRGERLNATLERVFGDQKVGAK